MPSTTVQREARRILIVDDSRATQAIIRRALEACGDELGPIEFETADNGADALYKVQSRRPDLVLSDWHMPGVSGLELLQKLRHNGFGDLPVGLVTAETLAECIGEARRNGACFVLHKPFDDGALCRMVVQWLAQQAAAPAGEPALKLPPPPLLNPVHSAPSQPAIESRNQLQQQLYTHLGTRSFELLRVEPDPELAERDTPQLVALYGCVGRSAAYAIGLLDTKACCMIGGVAGGERPVEILNAINRGEPSARQIDEASRFMRACAAQLRKREPDDVPSLSTARLARQRFEKLPSLLAGNHGRSELLLRLPGLGQGRLAFILV